MSRHIILPAVILFMCPSCLFAQRTNKLPDSLSKAEPSSYFKADVSYLTNNVYNGRKDSLRVPYLTPVIGYYHKSGLYAEASSSILTSSYAVRPDLSVVDAGYNYDKGNAFSGSLSTGKYFVSSQSVSVKSQLRGSIDASASYNVHDYITLSGGASYLFTDAKPDILFSAGISHEWDWGKDSCWSFAPAITTNLGTQNYFDSYQRERTRKTGSGKKNSTNPGTTTGITVSSLHPGRFAWLDYEASAPLYYDGKKWGAYFIPTFAIPESPDTYTITSTTVHHNRDGSTDTPVVRHSQTTESLTNSFYAQAGVYFVIKMNNHQKALQQEPANSK